MKKIIISVCLIIILAYSSSLALSIELEPNVKEGLHYEYTPKEGSIEELYKDVIASLIAPYISKAIENYYHDQYLYDLGRVKFLQIERPSGYRSFIFIIKVQVQPFIGAHNTIGVDNITIKIEGGNPTVENFEHIKSFQIPPHL